MQSGNVNDCLSTTMLWWNFLKCRRQLVEWKCAFHLWPNLQLHKQTLQSSSPTLNCFTICLYNCFMFIGLLLVEALPSLVSGRHFVFFLVLFLCCFVSVLTNKFIHSFKTLVDDDVTVISSLYSVLIFSVLQFIVCCLISLFLCT